MDKKMRRTTRPRHSNMAMSWSCWAFVFALFYFRLRFVGHALGGGRVCCVHVFVCLPGHVMFFVFLVSSVLFVSLVLSVLTRWGVFLVTSSVQSSLRLASCLSRCLCSHSLFSWPCDGLDLPCLVGLFGRVGLTVLCLSCLCSGSCLGRSLPSCLLRCGLVDDPPHPLTHSPTTTTTHKQTHTHVTPTP